MQRRKGKGFRTISTKILTFIGGAIVLSFILLLLIISRITSSSVTELRNNEIGAMSTSAANEINGYFSSFYTASDVLSKNSGVYALVTETTGREKMAETEGFDQVIETLYNVKSTGSSSVMFITVMDVDTSQYAGDDGSLSADDWDITSRAWFQQLKAEGKPIMSPPYLDSITNKQVVAVASPVFKKGTSEIIGAINVDLALDAVGEMMSEYKLGDTGSFMLTASNGQIIYHSNSDFINKNISDINYSDNLKEMLKSKNKGTIEFTVDGEHKYGYVTNVGDAGWMLAAAIPDEEYNQAATAVRNTMLNIFLVALVVVAAVILVISRQIVAPIKKLTKTADLIAEGNLNVAIDIDSADETGQMGKALNRTVVQLRRYTSYIREITRTLQSMAKGDMRIHLEEDYVGEFASIRTAFGEISTSLNRALHLINDAAEQVSLGADQVSQGAQALAAGSAEQAATIEELSASITIIADQAVENSENVRTATQFIEKTSLDVTSGNEHMAHLTAAMSKISSSSNQIANITKIIEDIAFQTNILALNAAVEAARAGETGKGFAVVADEVRNLAAKSAEAARQTADLIQHSVTTVSKGTQITNETAAILQQVGESTIKVTNSFEKIEQASAGQVNAIEQVKMGLNQVSAVVQSNAATAEENSATSEEMSAQAVSLRDEVGRFKLEY